MAYSLLKVLLVDDDEDDYVLTRSLFAEIQGGTFAIDWVSDYETALTKIKDKQHDVYLIDYRLNHQNGLNLLREAIASGCEAPIILLTGQGEKEVDMAAMNAGAADYLLKSEITASMLDRSIRYAIQHTQTLTQLRQTLREKQQLTLALANIQTGVVITDPNQSDNPVIFVNNAFTVLTGYDSSEVIGKNCRFLQGAETDVTTIQQIREAIYHLRPITCTLLNYRKDGSSFWNQLTINPVFDQQGKLINFLGLQIDVTPQQIALRERRKAEEALRESEERYALAAQGSNDGIWDWNLKTNAAYFSPRWKAMLGYQDAEIGNAIEEWLQRLHPEDLQWVERQLSEHLHGLTPHFECECRILHRDGNYRWMLNRGLAVQDSEGKASRIAGSQTDITAWKQAEEKLVHDALHDTLTGLPNRVLLMERLRHAMQL
ncbi:MAG TPA: PAS domain-containing protein, partial [Allocoleopsis sp.]